MWARSPPASNLSIERCIMRPPLLTPLVVREAQASDSAPNTVACMHSGVLWAIISAERGICARHIKGRVRPYDEGRSRAACARIRGGSDRPSSTRTSATSPRAADRDLQAQQKK